MKEEEVVCQSYHQGQKFRKGSSSTYSRRGEVEGSQGRRKTAINNGVSAQWFGTYMKVKSYTVAVVISLHCKHNMFTYISVSHKHTAKHCIISQLHTNIKATAPY